MDTDSILHSLSLAGMLAQTVSAPTTDAPVTTNSFLYALSVAGVVLGTLLVPIALSAVLVKWLRMEEIRNRLTVVLLSISVAVSVLLFGGKIKKGIDLQGGVILIYEIDEEATKALNVNKDKDFTFKESDMGTLVQSITRRVNPNGLNEVVVRPYGKKEIEIIVPELDQSEVDSIKRIVQQAGVLEFAITANESVSEHASKIELARRPENELTNYIYDGDKLVAKWVELDEKQFPRRPGEIRVPGVGGIPQGAVLRDRGAIGQILVLRDDQNITGSDLANTHTSHDRTGNPSVSFTLKPNAAGRFQALTSNNLPANGIERALGIVLDDKLLSSPVIKDVISNQGEISGRFTKEEIEFLVGILHSGSLQAVVRKTPISENSISSMLGADMVQKGVTAVVIAVVSVLIFLLVYYRFCGIIACVSLSLNLLFTISIMILLKAALTLPGLAGLVLSLGMSIDANVLIYERMREELAKGSTLRMAIRNGFSRAITAIIDSNLTAIITAVVMYVIGTDQIRGFAITLILGISMSMFTSITVVRLILDIWEKKRWIKTVTMMQFLTTSNFNFVKHAPKFLAFSLVIIGVGIATCFARGSDILDVDFSGGSSVQILLKDPMDIADVRKRVNDIWDDATINSVDVSGKRDRVYKIDTGITEEVTETIDGVEYAGVELMKKQLQDKLLDDRGQSLLEMHAMKVAPVTAVTAPAVPQTPATTAPGTGKVPPTEPMPTDTKPTEPKPTEPKPTEPKPTEPKPTEPKPTEPKPTEPKPTEPKADSAKVEPGQTEPAKEPAAASTDKTPVEKKPEDKKSEDKKPDEKAPGSAGLNRVRADAPLARGNWSWRMAAAVTLLLVDPAYADQLAQGDPSPTESIPAQSATPKVETPAKAETPQAETPAKSQAPKTETPATTATPAAPETKRPESDLTPPAAGSLSVLKSQAEFTFNEPVNATTLNFRIAEAVKAVDISPPPITKLSAEGYAEGSNRAFSKWTVQTSLSPEDATKVFGEIERTISSTPVWLASNKIGGKVAGDTKTKAIMAILASFVGIIAYIWFRFQKVVFGVAAVVALVHDVLVALAAIAVSKWVSPYLGFAQVDDFKIDLTVVAAFLTIIGYSLNDTIVIFDRLREVRGRSPLITEKMCNDSINQTLSRTLLTALLTFMGVVVLYFFGGKAIHAFAFTMLIGVIAGSYSTIFIATPLLLWWVQRGYRKEGLLPAR